MKKIVLTTLLVIIVLLFSTSSFGAIQKDFTVTCKKDKSSITLTASNSEIGSGSNSALFKCVRNTHISGQCNSEQTILTTDCTPKTTTSTSKFCSVYQCPAGYKLKSGANTINQGSNPTQNCCDLEGEISPPIYQDPCKPFKSALFKIQTEAGSFNVNEGSTIEISSSSQQGYLIVSNIALESGVDLYYDSVNIGNENPGGNAVSGMFSQFLTFNVGSHTIAAGPTNKNPCPPQISFTIKQKAMMTTVFTSNPAACGNNKIESGEVCDGTNGCATNYECASDCKSCKPKSSTVSSTPVYAIQYCSTYNCPSEYKSKSGASSIQQGTDPLNNCCDKTPVTSPCPPNTNNMYDSPKLLSNCDSNMANFGYATPAPSGGWCCYFYKGPLTCPSYQTLVGDKCVYTTTTSNKCGDGKITGSEECDSGSSQTAYCSGGGYCNNCYCEYAEPSSGYYTTGGGSSSSGPKYSTAGAVVNLFTGRSISNILKPKSVSSITGRVYSETPSASPSISVKVENSQYICFVNVGSMVKTTTNECGKDYCTLEGCKKTYITTTEKCGNAQKDSGEECDFKLGTLGCKEGQICTQSCKCDYPKIIPTCGNGKQDSREECGEPGLKCLIGTCEKCQCVVGGCTPSDDCRTNDDCVQKHKSGYYCEGCECRAPEIDEGCQVPPDECNSDDDCKSGLCQNCHCYVEPPKEDCYENGGDECSSDEDCGTGKCSGMPNCKCIPQGCDLPIECHPADASAGITSTMATKECQEHFRQQAAAKGIVYAEGESVWCEKDCKCRRQPGESYCDECPDPLYFPKPETQGFNCDLADPTVPSISTSPLPPPTLFGYEAEPEDNGISAAAGSVSLEPVDLEENPELKTKELELKELEGNLAKTISGAEPLLEDLNDLIEEINSKVLEEKELVIDKIDEVIAHFEEVKKLYKEYRAKLEDFLTKALELKSVTEENKATLLEKVDNEIKSVEDQLENLYNLKFEIEKAIILEEKYEIIAELQEEYTRNIEAYNAKSAKKELQESTEEFKINPTGQAIKSFSLITGQTKKMLYSKIDSQGEITEQDIKILENNVKAIISAIDDLLNTYDYIKDFAKEFYKSEKISEEDYNKIIEELNKEIDDAKENKKSIKKVIDDQEFDSARLFIRLQASLASNNYIDAKKALDGLQLINAIKDEIAQEYHRYIDAEQRRVSLLSEVENIKSRIPSANLLTTEIVFPRELIESEECNDGIDNDEDNAIDSFDGACQTGLDEVIDNKDVINVIYTLDPEFALAFALLLTTRENEQISQRIQDILYKDDEERNLDLFARILTNPTTPKKKVIEEVEFFKNIPFSVQDYAQPDLCTATGGNKWYPSCRTNELCLPFCSCPTGAFVEEIGCVNNPEDYEVQRYVATDYERQETSVTGQFFKELFTRSKPNPKAQNNKITGKAIGTGIPTPEPEIPAHELLKSIYDNLKIEEQNRKCRDIGESLSSNLDQVKLICPEMLGIIDGIKKALDDINELRKGLDDISEIFEDSYKDALDLFHKSQSGDGSTAGDDDDDAAREAYNDYKDEERAFDKVQEEYGLHGVDPDRGFSPDDLDSVKRGKPRNEHGRDDQKYIDKVSKDLGKNIQDLTINEVQQHLDNVLMFRNIAKNRYDKISKESAINRLRDGITNGELRGEQLRETIKEITGAETSWLKTYSDLINHAKDLIKPAPTSKDPINKEDYKNRAKNRVASLNGDQIVRKAYDYSAKLQSAVDNANEAAENAKQAAEQVEKLAKNCPESSKALDAAKDAAENAKKAADQAAKELENSNKVAKEAGLMWDVMLSLTGSQTISGIAGVSEEELEEQRRNIFTLSEESSEPPTIEKLAAKALEALHYAVRGKVYAEQAKMEALKANNALIQALIESLNCVKCSGKIPLGLPLTEFGCTPCKSPSGYLFPTQISAPEDSSKGTTTNPIPPPQPPSPSAQAANDLANAEQNLATQEENERNIGTRIAKLDTKEKNEELTDEERTERIELQSSLARTKARTTDLKDKIKNVKQPCTKEKVDEIQNNIKKKEAELENVRKESAKTFNDCKNEKTKAIEENAEKESDERSAEARNNLDSVVEKLRKKAELENKRDQLSDESPEIKNINLELVNINKGMSLKEADLGNSLEQSGIDINSGSIADAQNAAWNKLKDEMIKNSIENKVNSEKGNVDQKCREKIREFDEKVGPLEKQLSGLYELLDDCTPKVRTEETKDFKGAREILYDKYKQKLDEYNMLVEKAAKTADDLAKIDQLKNEIDWLRKELDKRATPEDKTVNQIVDTKNKVAALQARKKDLEDEIARQEKQKAETTDTEKLQEIQNSIDKLKAKLAEVTKELDSTKAHLSDLENSTSTTQKLAATKRHYEEQEARTKAEIELLNGLKSKLQKELESKKEGTVDYDKIKSDIEVVDEQIRKLNLRLLELRKLKEQAESDLTEVVGEIFVGPPPQLDISQIMKGVEGKYLTSEDLAKIKEILLRIKQAYDGTNPVESIKEFIDQEMAKIEKVGDQYKVTSVAQLIILNLHNAWIKAANKNAQQTFDYLQTLARYFFDSENPEASATKIEELARKLGPMLDQEVVNKFIDQTRNFKDHVQDQKARGVCAG